LGLHKKLVDKPIGFKKHSRGRQEAKDFPLKFSREKLLELLHGTVNLVHISTSGQETMLSSSEIESYHQDGFVIPDFRIDEETLEQIRSDHERLLKKHPEFLNYCPNVLAYDLSFLNYARIPEILDLVESVLGPDFALWNSSFFAKPAEKGQATPWHQDGEYWPIRPLATCTVWIAVDAANTENGCLQVIRGSHRSKKLFRHQTNPDPELTLNQELLKEEFDESNAVSMELEAGMISLHDVYLVHGSAVNRSSRSRRGLTLRFMPTSSVFDREWSSRMAREKGLVDHAERTLFLMRGKDLSGENDFRLRW